MKPSGMTLVELLLVIVILAITAAIAVPKAAALRDRMELRASRGTVLVALDAARGAAVRLGGSVKLSDEAGVLTVRFDTALVWSSTELPRRGVVLAGLGSPISFGPAGLATGASNRTLRLLRGSDTMSVVLSRLGRVRVD